MNKVILMGRLTKDPDIKTAQEGLKVARYTLAVDRYKDNTDFISCVAFRGCAEFAEKYLKKGTKIAVVGSIQTGSYTNKEGQKVYTTDVVVNEHYFAESKGNSDASAAAPDTSAVTPTPEGFMNIPDGIDEEIPFS